MNDMPFIHLLKSRYGYYFYDVNMNEIVNISKETYQYLSKLINNGYYQPLLTEIVNKDEKRLKEAGYLKNKHPSIEMPDMDNIEYYLNYKLHSLILQVTQKCNFRCKYCHFANDDVGYHNHNSLSMSWEIAKKAIDFFASRTRDTMSINISFYGGEPLLEYELIKKCIEYCNSMFEGKTLSYSLTTNAGLLSVRFVQYLIDNNVSIIISLDGPKEIHDKNRKLASDGSGTFDKIYENLNKIKKELPDYYQKLSFHSVIDPANDCSKINEFFSRDLFNNLYVSTNLLSSVDKKRLYYSKEYIKNDKKDTLLFLLAKTKIINELQMTPIARNYYESFEDFEKRFTPLGEIPDKIFHRGPCIPGANKLFVSANGKFLVCEKAMDNSNALLIGSLQEGFDIPKIKNICDDMKRERCKNCWNILNCNICEIKIDDGEKLSTELFDMECKNACRITESNLMNLIALFEVKAMINV